MVNDRDNEEIPRKGDIIKFHNGLVGEVIQVKGSGWQAEVEARVNGVRVYKKICDISVLNALDRIVNALNVAEEAESE